MSANDDENTDVDEYLRNNPKFAQCRKKGHDFPDEDDVPLLEAYDDPEATHEQVFVCARCERRKRARFRIAMRRGRVVSYVELAPRSGYAAGYVAKGVRISRRYVREVSIREALERQVADTRRTRSADRSRKTAVARTGRSSRKAVAA